ncbi:MAG: DNA-3-methyladenine glycosylase I [Sandaracinaceae bacterium]|nr:DNA-3-methyladenine glycosylase I [Sandaracinaceae bacterium]
MTARDTNVGDIFRAIERSLIEECRTSQPDIEATIEREVGRAGLDDSDDALFQKLVMVVFYSGFKAATVTAKRETILKHLGDWRVAREYGPGDVDRIVDDSAMIGHRRKVEACIANAKTVAAIVTRCGSFSAYLRDRIGDGALSDLLVLKEDLEAEFEYLGGITVYHFMTDLGLNVLKPDRVIMRIFHRLRLVDDTNRYFRAIQIGQRMASEAGASMRRVDRVLVAYGQVETEEFGLAKGICLEEKPRCTRCGVRDQCGWRGERGS